jgi:DNA-directed RNA polymerase subunit RPC12/RpoP
VNSTASQASLRRLYKNGNFTAYECAICHQEPIWQGKELTLILDHINGINNDDRLENLRWVCPNCNQQLETTGSRNLKQKTFVKKYFCQDCGIEISKTSVRCKTCSMKARAIPIEEMRVTREELKDLIRHQSFVSIGKKYQVSDNTIRKWCSKLQLPQKKSDIQKYSDDDWLKL